MENDKIFTAKTLLDAYLEAEADYEHEIAGFALSQPPTMVGVRATHEFGKLIAPKYRVNGLTLRQADDTLRSMYRV